MGAIILVICIFRYQMPISSFLILVPAGVVVFCISLIIGHLITEPLRILQKKAQAFQEGNLRVDFTPDGRLYESDALAVSFDDLVKRAVWRGAELDLQERRQAAFVSDVAHELRTPLTSIHGNAELLLDSDLPPELHEKFCNTIIAESERLSRLSNDLLTLQRIEGDSSPTHFARVNLNTITYETVDSLDTLIKERNSSVSISGEAPDVLGDVDRLKQVLTNLIDNATRFAGLKEGHVSIELYGLEGNSIIAVKDTGPGFAPEEAQLLFGRFYRSDVSRTRETGGTGLGLSIVKSIVENHDGTVEAFNRSEGGACFVVTLPSIPVQIT